MEMRWLEILVTVVITALVLLLEHWGPWQGVFQKNFHQVVNYVLGMLAIYLPLTVLFTLWRQWDVILAMWLAVVVGGLAVVGSYWVDGWVTTRKRLQVAEKESSILRPGVTNDEGSPEA